MIKWRRRTAWLLPVSLAIVCFLFVSSRRNKENKPLLSERPPEVSSSRSTGTFDAIRHNNLGVALMDRGQKDPKLFVEAAKEFQTALEINPAYIIAKINLGLAHYFSQNTTGQAWRKAESINQFESVLITDPNNLHANYMLGWIKGDDGNYEEAEIHFKVVTKSDPQDALSWFHLGRVRNQSRRYAEAIDPFMEATKLIPYHEGFSLSLYQVLFRAGRKAAASTEISRLEAVKAAGVQTTKGETDRYAYLSHGKYTEAIPEKLPSRDMHELNSGDLKFTDVARAAQLFFQHNGPGSNEELSKVLAGEPISRSWFIDKDNRRRLIASLGSGASFCDFDNDGKLDVFLVNCGGKHALYHNEGFGKFKDVTARSGLGLAPSLGMASIWGDYDHDGWSDVLVTGYGDLRLYKNEGNGTFSDRSHEVGITDVVQPDTWYMGAAFADVEHDSDLDIYVCSYVDFTNIPLKETLRFPSDFKGKANLLLRNTLLVHKDDSVAMKSYRDNTRSQQLLWLIPLLLVIVPFSTISVLSRRSIPRAIIFTMLTLALWMVFMLCHRAGAIQMGGLPLDDCGPMTYRAMFADISSEAKVDGGMVASQSVVFSDLNDDRAVDFIVANTNSVATYLNAKDGTFVSKFPEPTPGHHFGKGFGTSVAIADINGDVLPDSLVSSGTGGHAALMQNTGGEFSTVMIRVRKPTMSASLADLTNSGLMEPVLLPFDVPAENPSDNYDTQELMHRLESGWWDLISPTARGAAHGDFDDDGDIDILINNNGSSPTLLRNDTTTDKNWLKVRLEGFPQKTNAMGIGAKVEVRAVGLWQQKELRTGTGYLSCDPPEVHFGLGDIERLDSVRVTFPSGVRWSVHDVSINQTLSISEPQLKIVSCPLLFSWDGKTFAFLTDVISGGVVGELVAPGKYWQSDPDETLVIPADKLKARLAQVSDGANSAPQHVYDLRFTNPLEETTLLDQTRLVAVDHPSGWEIYPNERLVGDPHHRPEAYVFALSDMQLPVAAIDHHGNNVLYALTKVDRRYFNNFTSTPWEGFTEEWNLTLDFEPPKLFLPGSKAIIVLDGWTNWTSPQGIIGAHQAGVQPIGPVLEVLTEEGQWEMADANFGMPAGLPRTMVVDVTDSIYNDLNSSNQLIRIRIRSNLTIYFDRIRVGVESPGAQAQLNFRESMMLHAKLQWLGYPLRVMLEDKRPEIYQYKDPAQFSDLAIQHGNFTKYGNVKPLLKDVDDFFVIMNHGDEVALSFDADNMPHLAPNYVRTFLFHCDGYEKTMSIHGSQNNTVAPLPFHSMSGYPYGSGEAYPSDMKHNRYRLEWNTRPPFRRF